MAPLCYTAKFDPFLSLYCAKGNPRKRRDRILPSGNTVQDSGSKTPATYPTDDVADVCAAAVDDPVVAVEGQLVAHQRAEPGPRRELRGLASKVLQCRVPTFL